MVFLKKLKIIKLQGNKIDKDGVFMVYQIIKNYEQILSVDLRDNHGFSDDL